MHFRVTYSRCLPLFPLPTSRASPGPKLLPCLQHLLRHLHLFFIPLCCPLPHSVILIFINLPSSSSSLSFLFLFSPSVKGHHQHYHFPFGSWTLAHPPPFPFFYFSTITISIGLPPTSPLLLARRCCSLIFGLSVLPLQLRWRVWLSQGHQRFGVAPMPFVMCCCLLLPRVTSSMVLALAAPACHGGHSPCCSVGRPKVSVAIVLSSLLSNFRCRCVVSSAFDAPWFCLFVLG